MAPAHARRHAGEALFRSGGIQSPQNMVGVGLVAWQWILLNRILSGARALPG